MGQFTYITDIRTLEDKRKAFASMIFGVVSAFTWLLPIVGIPISIIGMIMGYSGRKSTRRSPAIIGITLCVVSFIAALVNGINGARTTLSHFPL